MLTGRLEARLKDIRLYLVAPLAALVYAVSLSGYDLPISGFVSELVTPLSVLFMVLAGISIYDNKDAVRNLYIDNKKAFPLVVLLVGILFFGAGINWAVVSLLLFLAFYSRSMRSLSLYLFLWLSIFFLSVVLLGAIFPDLARPPLGKVSSFFGDLTGLQASSLGFTNPNQPLFFFLLIAINGAYAFARSSHRRAYAAAMIVVATVLYSLSLSRTSYLVVMLFLGLYLLNTRVVYVFLRRWLVPLVLLLTIFSIFVAIFFGQFDNPINAFLTNRPFYWNLRVNDGGLLNLWGNMDAYSASGRPEAALDNNYLNLIFRYGWLVYVVVIYLIFIGKRQKTVPEEEAHLLGLFAIAVYFLSESMPFTMVASIVLTVSMQQKFTLSDEIKEFVGRYDRKVTVVVPIFNAEKYLRSSVDSILGQTHENLEVILVDDGSHDDSGKIIDEYKRSDERVVVIHKKNTGVSGARNRALDVATGHWVIFVDADDMLPRSSVERMLSVGEASGAQCVSGAIRGFASNANIDLLDSRPPADRAEIINADIAVARLLYQRGVVNGPYAKLYSRSAIDDIRFRDDISVGEDLLFNYMVLSELQTVAIMRDTVYYYRNHPESVINRSFSGKRMSGLVATNQVLTNAQERGNGILLSAQNRHFMEAVFISSQIDSKRESKEAYDECIEAITACRGVVVFDARSPLEYRLLAAVSFLSPALTVGVYRAKVAARNWGRRL